MQGKFWKKMWSTAAVVALAGSTIVNIVTPSAVAASAINGATGHETSVAYTVGKAQGSYEWGLVGNLDFDPSGDDDSFAYGIGINPVSGDLWVSDSGKVCWGMMSCFMAGAGFVSSAQAGEPHLRIYPKLDTLQTDYTKDGVYTTPTTNENTSGRGSDWGDPQIIRTGIFDSNPMRHGPRKIAFDEAGNGWVIDSEFEQSREEATANGMNRIKRFAVDGTQLPGAGYKGKWANTDNGSFRAGYSVSVSRMQNGDFLANSEVANWLVRFAPDTTPKAPIVLNNLAVPAALQATLGTNVSINPYGVDVDPQNGNIYVAPVKWAHGGTWTTANERYGGVFVLNPEGTELINFFGTDRLRGNATIFGPFTNSEPNSANYGNIFVNTQDGLLQEFTPEGVFVREYANGSAAANNAQQGVDKLTANPTRVAVPGFTRPRGVDFDSHGYMYVTAQEGTANSGVRILGHTPRPITKLNTSSICVDNQNDAQGASANVHGPIVLSWEHLQTASHSVAPTLDYTIEMSLDAGATWSLVPTAKSTNKYEIIARPTGEDFAQAFAAGTVAFRVAAWNSAGNGNWLAADLMPTKECQSVLNLAKTGAYDAQAKQVQWNFAVDAAFNPFVTASVEGTDTNSVNVAAHIANTVTVTDAAAPAGVSDPEATLTAEQIQLTVEKIRINDPLTGITTPVVSYNGNAETELAENAQQITGRVGASRIDVSAGDDKNAQADTDEYKSGSFPAYVPNMPVTAQATSAVSREQIVAGTRILNENAVATAQSAVLKLANPEYVAGTSPVSEQYITYALGALSSNPAAAWVTPTGTPNIDVVKSGVLSANGNSAVWTITVTNNGEVPLSQITLTDQLTNQADTAVLSSPTVPVPADLVLQPGEKWSTTLTTAVSDTDRVAGGVWNKVRVVGTAPNTQTVEDQAQAALTLTGTDSLSIAKSGVLSADGTQITWTVTVTNTGNLTLTNVAVTDPLVADLQLTAGDAASLAPGATLTYTGTYQVTEADKLAGKVVNIANVSADSPKNTKVKDSSTAQVPTRYQASLQVVKRVAEVTENEIAWEVAVTNTGDVTLSEVALEDTLGDLDITWPAEVGKLAPGATLTATLITEVTADMRTAGYVVNEVIASGKVNGVTISGEDSARSEVFTSQLEVTKTGVYDATEQLVQWSFVIANTGNTTLENIEIEDLYPDLSAFQITWPEAEKTLAPGQQVVFTATAPAVQTTQEQTLENTVTVQAVSGFGVNVTKSAKASVQVPAKPVLPAKPTTPSGDKVKPIVPTSTLSHNKLANTGATILGLTLGALALVGAGVVVVLVRRRRNDS